jgi:hypothetical protein
MKYLRFINVNYEFSNVESIIRITSFNLTTNIIEEQNNMKLKKKLLLHQLVWFQNLYLFFFAPS